MKSNIVNKKEISTHVTKFLKIVSDNCQSFESSLLWITVCKTNFGNLIRFTIDIANCHHKAFCEILKGNEWKTLFTRNEVRNYESIPYYKCTVCIKGKFIPISQIEECQEQLMDHFMDVYSEIM